MRDKKFKLWNGKKMSEPFDISQNPIYWTKFLYEAPEAIVQYTGIDDKNGTEIYEGDIVSGSKIVYEFLAVVKFGEFEQDASGGEYSGAMCMGFYVDLLNKEKLDEWELQEYPEYIHTTSLAEIVDLEVIGNIYEDPHLLERDS